MIRSRPTIAHPEAITLHQGTQRLEIRFSDGNQFFYPSEFLRVYSPSAEVRGHGVGQAVLQTGKQDITIVALEPVGHYALKIIFSDGHDSGLYSWQYLQEIGAQQDKMWLDYLQALDAAGGRRTPD